MCGRADDTRVSNEFRSCLFTAPLSARADLYPRQMATFKIGAGRCSCGLYELPQLWLNGGAIQGRGVTALNRSCH